MIANFLNSFALREPVTRVVRRLWPIARPAQTLRSLMAVTAGTILFIVNLQSVHGEGFQGTSVDLQTLSGTPADLKKGVLRKVDGELLKVSQEYATWRTQGGTAVKGPFKPSNARLPMRGKDLIAVDVTAQDDTDTLIDDLRALGCQRFSAFKRMVSAWCPVGAIEAMGQLKSLNFVRPALATNNVGLVTSQGDPAMRSDDARALYGVDGSGLIIGTLSDSYNCLGGAAADVVSGDLPAGINVLADVTGVGCPTTDEGRGMMQLIADVAPGAAQAFYTAFNGQADFASGITQLQSVAGAHVIVDDVVYFAEPMFQDGNVAQAVDTVEAAGVAYFSSAINSGRDSWEDTFRPSGQTETVFGGQLHDFDPGPGVDIYQTITLPDASFTFQWDEPYFQVSGAPGSSTDYDIWICVDDTQPVNNTNCPVSGTSGNIGGDPIEVIGVNVAGPSTTAYIAISRYAGTTDNFLKYIVFANSLFSMDEYDTASSTTYGHANAAGAEAVGAAFYYNTPEFGTAEPVLNDFSSAGGTPIYFDLAGNRLTFPITRQKPEITAPDGTNTTFFGSDIADPGDGSDLDTFPNFFGTSAAAPHAAAVAALMLDAAGGPGTLTPNGIYSTLESTAIDIQRRSPEVFPSVDPGFDNLPVGFDFDSGYGLIQADIAVQRVLAHPCCNTGGPGCIDASIRNAVCAVDSFCCNVFWDDICVGEVTTETGDSCDCCEAQVDAEGCFQDVSSLLSAALQSPWQQRFSAARAAYDTDPLAFLQSQASNTTTIEVGANANLRSTQLATHDLTPVRPPVMASNAVVVEDFPSALSTIVANGDFLTASTIGYFWSAARGDSVEQTFTSSVPAGKINRAIFDISVPDNVLSPGNTVDWDVLIEGVTVGSFQVVDGQTGAIHLDFSFPVINLGNVVTLRFQVTNEVPPGGGSHTLSIPGMVQLIGSFDDDVSNCVCAADPYCCNAIWDSICVDEVESLGCGLCEGCGTPPAPDLPDPVNGAVGVPLGQDLSWNGAGVNALVNGGFERGSFFGWTTVTGPGGELTPWSVTTAPSVGFFLNAFPVNGRFFAQNGFDGEAGMFYDLYQEVTIPGGATTAVLSWYERIQWDMLNYVGSTLPRTYLVTLEPAGGGAPLATLYSRNLDPATLGDTGYVFHAEDLLALAPAIAGSTVRIHWREEIPETFTGPGQFELDGASLVTSPVAAAALLAQAAGGEVIPGSRSTPEREAQWRATYRDKVQQYKDIQSGKLDASLLNATEAAAAQAEVPDGFVVQAGALVSADQAAKPSAPLAPAEVPLAAPQALTGTLINFDDISTAPCFFAQTTRLTNEYAALGVVFEGPGGNDGGAVLDECSNFGVTGQSSTNFLAFNASGSGVTMLDGGEPVPPETLRFDPAVSQVQALVGSGFTAGEITMEAYNANDELVDTATVATAGVFGTPLQTIRVTGTGITRVVLKSTATGWVLDDLRFETCPLTYDVLFGTSSPPTTLLCADTTDSVCDPGALSIYTTYFWQVIAKTPAGSTAGPIWSFTTVNDTDADGLTDDQDNCILHANGPVIPDLGGNSQLDTDGDGFGNACDPDFNNNFVVDPLDFSLLKSVFGSAAAPDQDLNGNGVVDPFDFSLLKSFFGKPPGPSAFAAPPP